VFGPACPQIVASVATLALAGVLATPAFAQDPDNGGNGFGSPAPPGSEIERIDGPPAPLPPAVINRDEAGNATVRTMRLPSPLVFDGALDEAPYRDVPSMSDFIQQEPNEGGPASDRTEIWIFFDERNLYIGARLWESEKGRRVTSDMRRDSQNFYNNDHVAILFDTFYDRRNGLGVSANSQGGMFDWAVTNEFPNNNWNQVWNVRTAEFDGGWSAEFVVPFRSLRFREGSTIWGVNVRRMVRWRNVSRRRAARSTSTSSPTCWARRSPTSSSRRPSPTRGTSNGAWTPNGASPRPSLPISPTTPISPRSRTTKRR
jgi:hypothetical protein